MIIIMVAMGGGGNCGNILENEDIFNVHDDGGIDYGDNDENSNNDDDAQVESLIENQCGISIVLSKAHSFLAIHMIVVVLVVVLSKLKTVMMIMTAVVVRMTTAINDDDEDAITEVSPTDEADPASTTTHKRAQPRTQTQTHTHRARACTHTHACARVHTHTHAHTRNRPMMVVCHTQKS